jgi:hypothetical protein
LPIQIQIIEETAGAAIQSLQALAGGLVKIVSYPAADAAPAPEPVVETVVAPATRGRKKAPAAEVVIDQGAKQADIEDVTGKTAQPANDSVAMLTVEDMRERIRQFHSAGHMDEVAAEMTARGIKKSSDVDPDAGNKPSAKFAAYVAAIEARISAKPKLEA